MGLITKAAAVMLGLATAALAAGLVAVAVPPTASAAGGQTYTWTCPHNADWADSECWDLGSAPGDGDSVVISAGVPVTNVPVLTLQDLTLTGTQFTHLDPPYDTEGGLTVTGHLAWTGGTLNMPLTLPPGATGTIGGAAASYRKEIDGDLTVGGDLTFAGTGGSDETALRFDFDHSLIVQPGASVVAHGSNRLLAARCCSSAAPSRVINQGQVTVADGVLDLDYMGLDQRSTISVGDGAQLTQEGGMVRLRAGSVLHGPGTAVLSDTTGPDIDTEHPDDNQGAILLDGAVGLDDAATLAFGEGAVVTGVGSVTGHGLVRLSGATVYGSLATGSDVALAVTGGTSAVSVWSEETGYTGRLSVGGPGAIARGAALQANGRTVTRVLRGGSLAVAGGGRITSRSCCTSDPTVVVDPGGRMILGDATGRAARVEWTTLANNGELDVAGTTTWDDVSARQSSGTLRLGGALRGEGSYALGKRSTTIVALKGKAYGRLALDGDLRLGGTLRTTGSAPHGTGRTLTILKGGARSGRFGCARTPGWIPSYSGKAAVLNGAGRTPSGCLQAVSAKKRLSGKVGTRARGFTVPFGSADAVVLDVRVKAPRGTVVTLATPGGGKVSLRTGKGALHRLVAVPVGHSSRFTARTRHGSATVTVTYQGRYR